MNKKIGLLLLFSFFLSRLIFINAKDVFFDSGEYLSLFANPNLLKALTSGHFPLHEGYILLFWPVFQIAKFFYFDPAYSVIFTQIALSALSTYCFYKFLILISDKKAALVGTIIASITPLFWITNVTIMMESSYVSFFFFSLYFLAIYLTKNKNLYFLHASIFFFTLSVITHTMVILWLPFVLFIVFLKKRQKLWEYFIWAVIYLAILSLFKIIFIATVSKIDLSQVIYYLYTSKVSEFAYLPLNIKGFLVMMRNFALPLMRNNTSLIVILGFISLLMLLKKNKTLFILNLFWIAPSLYTNQWWDALLAGRHSLIAGFGLAFLSAYLLRKNKFFTFLLISYLLLVSIPALNLLKKEIPYIREANFAKSLPKDSLFLESHFARPQIQKTYREELISVNEPGSLNQDAIAKKINSYLENNKKVFVSSSALSEPYGLYSGPYLHYLSLSYLKSFELESLMKKYTLITYKVLDSKDNLLIYEIISTKKSSYPTIKSMKDSYRRIDYYDPFWRIYKLFFSLLTE